jgi:hypothetical protein
MKPLDALPPHRLEPPEAPTNEAVRSASYSLSESKHAVYEPSLVEQLGLEIDALGDEQAARQQIPAHRPCIAPHGARAERARLDDGEAPAVLLAVDERRAIHGAAPDRAMGDHAAGALDARADHGRAPRRVDLAVEQRSS